MHHKIKMLSFEDYSLTLSYDEEREYYEYVGCDNRCIIRKGSFAHLMSTMGKRDFAVLSACRCGLSKEENVCANRAKREVLQALSLRAYCLVYLTESGTVARHYLVERPDAMPSDRFEKCIADSLCGDETALYRRESEYFFLYPDGTFASGAPVLADEIVVGVEEPATNMGKMLFASQGLCSPSAPPRQDRKLRVAKSATQDESGSDSASMSHDRTFRKTLKEEASKARKKMQ